MASLCLNTRKRVVGSTLMLIIVLLNILESESMTRAVEDLTIQDLLKEGYISSDVDKGRETIVLVGSTGSGKSTLSKFIRRDSTLRIERNAALFWIFSDGDDQIGSTSSHLSKTLLPNVDVDKETGVQVVDCAGFEDTRSPDTDLRAAYFNGKILNSCEKAKLVIVENFYNLQLNGNRDSFTRALKQTANLIGANVDSFEGSIGLVATKVDNCDGQVNVTFGIKVFLNETLNYLQAKKKQSEEKKERKRAENFRRQVLILQFLIDGDNLEIFRRPPGDSPLFLEAIEENRKRLRKLVFEKLSLSKPFTKEFRVTIAAATVNYINENLLQESEVTLQEGFQNLQNILLEDLGKMTEVNIRPMQRSASSVFNFCKEYLNILDGIDDSFEQVNIFAKRRCHNEGDLFEIRFQLDLAKFLHKTVGKDVDEVERKFISNLKSTLATKVQAELDFSSFLQHLIRDFGNYETQSVGAPMDREVASVTVKSFSTFAANLRKWGFSAETSQLAYYLNPTEANVKALNMLENELKHDGMKLELSYATLIVSQRFLVLSQVKDQITGDVSGIGEIVLIAGEKLFVDCDLSIQQSHLKLVAPLVEIVGNTTRTIHLRGENQEIDLGKAADCVRGVKEAENGANGHEGYSPGNFTLMALEVRNGHLLNVMSEGGNGGPGQDGGDGCDLKPYDWPVEISEEHISGVSKFCDTERLKQYDICKMSNKIDRNYYTYESVVPVLDLIYRQIKEDLTLTQDGFQPTNGGDGGAGGSGAKVAPPRFILKNVTALREIKVTSLKGKDGVSGKGGKAGRTIINCWTAGYYECRFTTWRGPRELNCRRASVNKHPYLGKHCYGANDGRANNSKYSGGFMRQKFSESKLVEQAYQYYKVVFEKKLPLHADSDIGRFLNFLFDSSEEFFSQLTALDFRNMIEDAESSAQSAKDDLRDQIQRLHFLYSSMLQTVRKWRHVDDDAIEYTLIGQLDTLQAFLHGRQVVQLSALVEAQQKRLSDIVKAADQVGRFEAVADEVNSLKAKIADAESLVKRVKDRKLDESKESMGAALEALMSKTDEMKKHYSETDRILVEHQKDVTMHMWTNVGLGVFNLLTTVVGAFYPPIAIAGQVITDIAKVTFPGPGELKYESHVQKAVQNAKAVVAEFEKLQGQKEAKREHLIVLFKEIMDEDAIVGFLKEENRKRIKTLLNEDDDSTDLESVIKDLESIKTDLQENEQTAKNENLRKRVDAAKLAVTVPLEVAKTYQQYSKDSSKSKQIDKFICQNQVNLREMAVYEENVMRMFKPMVDQMVDSFASASINLEGKNSIDLLFQRMDLKHYARMCILMVQKLTEDFFTENEGFAATITELEELLNTLIEAFDKIDELRYRVQLAEFVGKMSGVKCLTESDPINCNKLEREVQLIKTNQLVREFAHVFTAYQQVSYPFAADKVHLLGAAYLSLRSTPKERLVQVLESTLKLISRDLSDDARSTNSNKDTDVKEADFNSRHNTLRPFFVWTTAQNSEQIANLLRGERVTLMASPSASGVRNAVKANWVALNVTSKDESTAKQLGSLLSHFQIEMVRSGESYFRCGGSVYALGGVDLNLTMSFERNDKGRFVTQNKVTGKLSAGDVPLSPYVLWKFKLVHASQTNSRLLFTQLAALSDKVYLELIGGGNYVNEGAAICSTDLSKAYDYVGKC